MAEEAVNKIRDSEFAKTGEGKEIVKIADFLLSQQSEGKEVFKFEEVEGGVASILIKDGIVLELVIDNTGKISEKDYVAMVVNELTHLLNDVKFKMQRGTQWNEWYTLINEHIIHEEVYGKGFVPAKFGQPTFEHAQEIYSDLPIGASRIPEEEVNKDWFEDFTNLYK